MRIQPFAKESRACACGAARACECVRACEGVRACVRALVSLHGVSSRKSSSFKDRGQCTRIVHTLAHSGVTWPGEVLHAVLAEVDSLSAIFCPPPQWGESRFIAKLLQILSIESNDLTSFLNAHTVTKILVMLGVW